MLNRLIKEGIVTTIFGTMLLGMFLQFMTALSDFINYVVWG